MKKDQLLERVSLTVTTYRGLDNRALDNRALDNRARKQAFPRLWLPERSRQNQIAIK